MKNGINNFLLATVIIVAACACGNNRTDSKAAAIKQNDQPSDSTYQQEDIKFAVNAADGGMLEVRLGALVQAYGVSAAVKGFGKRMVDDHTKSNEALRAVAQKNKIDLPDDLSKDALKEYSSLEKKTGKDLDKAYITLMIYGHKDAIEAFQKESVSGTNDDLRAWAGEELPMLKEHLQLAEQALDTVKINR